jgi:replicative DNA helicase
MKNKHLSPEELLRLCGFTNDDEISNYSWMISQGLADDEHKRKVQLIVASLEQALDEFRINRKLDISAIRKANSIIESLVRIDEKTTEQVLSEIEDKQDDPNYTMVKYRLKSFPTLEKATCGLEKGSYIFSADPNVGKTAILSQLTNDLLLSNDGASVRVLFVSLDDDKDDIIKRLIANMSYFMSNCNPATATTINSSARYYDFYDNLDKKWKQDPKARQIKKMATEIIKENVKAKRLVITDSSHSLTTLKTAIMDAGSKNLVVMIDAVYNIDVDGSNPNDVDDKISKGIKKLAREFKIPMVCVKDLRKPEGERKTSAKMADMKGSGKWGYDAVFVASLSIDNGRVKMWIDKNKKSEFKNRSVYYNFIPEKNIYQELSE